MSSERSLSNYVQGAADDSESWALGLDAKTFWQHSKQLLSKSEDELPAFIQSTANGSSLSEARKPVLIKPTTNIWISNNNTAMSQYDNFDFVISCSERPIDILIQKMKPRYVHLCCTKGKVGSRQLRIQFQRLQSLLPVLSSDSKGLVTCHTGQDLAVGVALALLSLCCADNGVMLTDTAHSSLVLNKSMIKHRLSWIMVSMPDAAPSRATLQSVNAFLLG
jgi:tRNA A64-2'-O-ribosylphosphate transferase